MPKTPKYDRAFIFGARSHDPDWWRTHAMVESSEVHLNEGSGWVCLKLKAGAVARDDRPRAKPSNLEAVQDSPDIYFWGEGDCPVDVFEMAPDVSELRVWIEGPIEGDDRTCWSVGLWLRNRDAST